METLRGVKRLVATVDRVLSEHSQWCQRVNMQLQLKWSTAFTQKKSARGNTRKTGKTHFIASACIVSCRRLGIADASLSLIAHGLCQFPRWREINSLPRGETPKARERERGRDTATWFANRNWPNELEQERVLVMTINNAGWGGGGWSETTWMQMNCAN